MKDVHSGQMKLVEETAIDLRGWLLFQNGDKGHLKAVNDWLAESVTATLQEVFNEDPPKIDFPIAWGDSDGRFGKAPKDPATIYISLPLGATEDENVEYSCSLEGAIDDLIELHEATDESGKIEAPEGRDVCKKLAARLRELADKLDKACEP